MYPAIKLINYIPEKQRLYFIIEKQKPIIISDITEELFNKLIEDIKSGQITQNDLNVFLFDFIPNLEKAELVEKTADGSIYKF